MKHLHFDSVGGASGDMILAAILDLGVSRADLQRRLAGLPIGPFEIEAASVSDRASAEPLAKPGQGLHGTRVHVHVASQVQAHAGADNPHASAHPPHRGLREIRALIEGSHLPPSVQTTSLRVFQRLAEAEAQVHGTTPDQVRFHEVGAVDAIVDIVGACLGLEMLGVTSVSVGPLPLGHGAIECAHGILPVPAPATVELLKGFPVAPANEPFELVTPTGAALLMTWKTLEAFPPGSRILKVGQGFGRRILNGRPNVLRAMLMESGSVTADTDACLVLECNLDDLIPELTGSLMNRLMDVGALDVFLTPVQMKKQRPGILLTVLCRLEQRAAMLDLIFRESTTFGIREHSVQRTVLERRHANVATPYGQVRVKIGRWQGADITVSPEYEDCLRAAESAGVPMRVVYEAALKGNSEFRMQT